MFYDPSKGVYRGHDEIDRIAGEIRATHLDFRYQPIAEPEEEATRLSCPTPAVELGVRPDAEQVHLQRPAFAIVAALTKRIDISGWQRQQPGRYVAGRRPPSPEEFERQRRAHEAESEAHQANSGGVDWLTTMQKKNPKKARQLQKTTQSPVTE